MAEAEGNVTARFRDRAVGRERQPLGEERGQPVLERVAANQGGSR